MMKRTLVTGVVVLMAAAAAPTAWAGEEDPTTAAPPVTDPGPPVTVTQPAPPAPPPVTVTVTTPAPPPQTVTVTAPAPKPAPAARRKPTNTNKSPGRSKGSSKPRVVTVAHVRNVAEDTDTGAVPSGGIQAGAGGMAGDGDSQPLLGIGSGALALLLTGGAVVRRRVCRSS
jgi:outer membrane biosynthesis protein TonB